MVTTCGGPQHFRRLLDLLSDLKTALTGGIHCPSLLGGGGHNSPGDEPNSNSDLRAATPYLLHQIASLHKCPHALCVSK